MGYMFYTVYTISEQELTGFYWSYFVHNADMLLVITPSNVVMQTRGLSDESFQSLFFNSGKYTD